MPALQTSLAELRIFEALGENCGVCLWNSSSEDLGFRFREDWDLFAGEEASTLRAIAEDLPSKAGELGPQAFLDWVDQTLSNTFRVLPPAQAICAHFDRTLQSLYRRHVQTHVQQFVTHLPLYSLRACAGGFGEDKSVEAEDWVEAKVPGRRSLDNRFFLARIKGRSMEPDIPDGSLCVFRWYSGGSRKGRIWLVERFATSDEGGEVTIKRYDSETERDDQGWRHKKITMIPGNPEYAEWGLREDDQFKTLAEFVYVLEDPE